MSAPRAKADITTARCGLDFADGSGGNNASRSASLRIAASSATGPALICGAAVGQIPADAPTHRRGRQRLGEVSHSKTPKRTSGSRWLA